MKHTVLFILLFSLSIRIVAQGPVEFVFEKKIAGDITSFAVDMLENIYLLSSTGQLKKVDNKGYSISVFNDVKNFGQVSYMDVSNPLKVLLYYKDFGKIVVLDRLLNVRNTIDLRKMGIMQVKAIGQSYDNNIWLYDELENKLKKINEEGKILLETPDLRQIIQPVPAPQQIIDRDRYVYLYDSTKAVYVFDYFGTLKNKIVISGWQNLHVSAHHIFGTMQNHYYRYDIRSFMYDEGDLPAVLHSFSSLQFTNSKLYVLKNGELYIYSLKPANAGRN